MTTIAALTWEVFLDGLRRSEPWAYLLIGFMVVVAFMACLSWFSRNPMRASWTDGRDA